jgi:PKD repeat protein
MATGAVVTHTYPALGTYTARVTATNSLGQQTATTLVTVVDEPIAGLAAANNGPTALGSPTTLTATLASGTNPTCTWNLGDGSPLFPALCPLPLEPFFLTHTYAAVGSYTAVVTASNYGSTATATTTVLVEEAVAGLQAVNDSPTALGDPTILIASVTAGTDVQYRWDLGDGTVLLLPFLAHVYPALGDYTAVVTASNQVSLLTATTTVHIVPDVPITGLRAHNDGPTPLGRITILSATVTAGSNITYTWALGDGTAGSGAVLTHTYPVLGTYTAVVTASNSVSRSQATTVVTVKWPYAVYLPLVVRNESTR